MTTNTNTSSYKEVQIGRTLYRVTSVYSGEKDLKSTLENLAVRSVLNEMRNLERGVMSPQA